MEFSFDRRLGIAGIIVAFMGVGVTILWPDKRMVGWGFLSPAALLTVFWIVAEVRRGFGKSRLLMALCLVTVLLILGLARFLVWRQMTGMIATPLLAYRDWTPHVDWSLIAPIRSLPSKLPLRTGEGLEVLEFNSVNSITLQNHSSVPITVLGVTSTLPSPMFASLGVNDIAEIQANETKKIMFVEFNNIQVTTVRPAANTWKGQVEASGKEFKGCYTFLYLLPSGAALRQITSAIAGLPLGDAKAEITYRVGSESRILAFDVKAIVVHVVGCVPQP